MAPDQRPPETLPDPWLFDSEKLLRELARCRELVLNVPINDTQATHFGLNIAINAIWNRCRCDAACHFSMSRRARFPNTQTPKERALWQRVTQNRQMLVPALSWQTSLRLLNQARTNIDRK
jgi:hypothetical protein